MMDDHGITYNLALFTHIVGVLVLFAMFGVLLAGMVGMLRASTVERVRAGVGVARGIGPVFPVPNALILLGGLYMAVTEWGWTTPWIDVSLAGLLVMALLGRFVIGTRIEAVYEAAYEAAPEGLIPEALHRHRADPVLWTTVLSFVSVVVGIVFLMAVKPGLAGVLATMGIAVVIGIAIAAAIVRPPRSGTGDAAHPTRQAIPD